MNNIILTYYGYGLWKNNEFGRNGCGNIAGHSSGDGVSSGQGDLEGYSYGSKWAKKRCYESLYGDNSGGGNMYGGGDENGKGEGYGYRDYDPPKWRD